MPRTKEFDEQEVLEKAMMLFWKKGYYNTSIDELVLALGINRGSLYSTFGGKKSLFDRAFEFYRRSNQEKLKSFLSTQEDVRAGLRTIFRQIIMDDDTDIDCKGCFIVNTTTELLPNDESVKESLLKHKKKNEEIFYNFLRRGIDSGQISKDKDIKVISSLLYIFLNGLRVNGKIKPDKKRSLATVDTIIQLLD